MNIDIEDPKKLHGWLEVAAAQRKRQLGNFNQQFGEGSAPSNAAAAELSEIQAIQGKCIKALAAAPLKR